MDDRSPSPDQARRSPPVADGAAGLRHVFIRDLVLEARIGIMDHERAAGQRVRINVDLAVADEREHGDKIDNVVCYSRVVEGIRAIIAGEHINLAETLAERIAELALADDRVRTARVRVEKLDVLAEAASVGVEIERRQTP